jgi:hypothetical protein
MATSRMVHDRADEETKASTSRALALTFADPDHPDEDERFLTFGRCGKVGFWW